MYMGNSQLHGFQLKWIGLDIISPSNGKCDATLIQKYMTLNFIVFTKETFLFYFIFKYLVLHLTE